MSGINEVFDKMKEDMEIPEVVEERAEQAFTKILLSATEQTETMSGKTCRQEIPKRKKEKKKKIIFASLIAATFCMTAAVAAVGFHLPDIFQREFASEELMEEIQMDIPVEVSGQKYIPIGLDEASKEIFNSRPIIEDPSALLEIKETLYDGMSLYVYCEATENGKKYELGGDRIYVDGIETQGGVVTDDAGKTYVMKADLSQLEEKPEIEVTIPLSIYKGDTRYQNQELTFHVKKSLEVITVENQKFVHDGYTIEVSEIKASATQLHLRVIYHLEDQAGEKYRSKDGSKEILISPAIKIDGRMYLGKAEIHETEEYVDAKMDISGNILSSSEILLCSLLPNEKGYISQGEELSEDVIKLK